MHRLVDIDNELLDAARAALGTQTIEDTVNRVIANAAEGSRRVDTFASDLDRLAQVELVDPLIAAADVTTPHHCEGW